MATWQKATAAIDLHQGCCHDWSRSGHIFLREGHMGKKKGTFLSFFDAKFWGGDWPLVPFPSYAFELHDGETL